MAWAIDRERKVIYIHVPKTGGRSLFHPSLGAFRRWNRQRFRSYRGHKLASKLKEELGSAYKDYFVFGMVRNPYERIVSIYIKEQLVFGMKLSLNEWLDAEVPGRLGKFTMLRPQWFWLCNGNQNVIVSHIARYENYDEEVELLCEKLRISPRDITIPCVGKTFRDPWQTYFDQEALDKFNSRNWADFQLFGYEKCLTL